MPRYAAQAAPRPVYECVAPFTIWRDGLPVTYAAGHKVDADDPIRRTHGDAFAPVTARPVEQATAAPGERRPVQIPPAVLNPTAPETTDPETKEAENG